MIDLGINTLGRAAKSDSLRVRRGPVRLFTGESSSAPTPARKEADPFDGLPSEVVKLAKERGYGVDTARFLALVLDTCRRTGEPLTIDTFELAAALGVTTQRATDLKTALLRAELLRRSHTSGSLSMEGLIPGAWAATR
ncbi:hypothetical protein [Methylobacterium nodulans]|uniref:Uncharacterized protein n=1 Tax=Methylobacterium nodulans (strain LMG 21967 / CNCM I-2342 / ORS 2060) TaxID=460265 RepID=B8IMQ7_METNO|nr:hypothetical protein [Methylobacterium nodulans]ACL60250.1 hypothetical protein Mnod_5406 [Methylobacterium nodulans ORS 2060]